MIYFRIAPGEVYVVRILHGGMEFKRNLPPVSETP